MKSLVCILIVFFTLSLIATTIEQPDRSQNLPTTEPSSQRITNTWDGSSSTLWETGANWSQNHAPASGEDVVIPGGLFRNPTISATAGTCNSLTVQTGATLTIQANALTIGTFWYHQGTVRLSNNAAVIVVGTTLEFFSGSNLQVSAGVAPEVRVSGDLIFDSGANISMTGGRMKLTGSGSHSLITNSLTTLNKLTIGTTNRFHADTSGGDLVLNDSLNVLANCSFVSNADVTTTVKGNIGVGTNGILQFTNGFVSLQGSSNTTVNLYNSSSYFLNLDIAKTAGYHVSQSNMLYVHGNLTIISGALWTGSWDIYLGGNWQDNVADGFDGGTHTYFNGTADQYIYGTEQFTILDLMKSSGWLHIAAGANVTASGYRYHSGQLIVEGTFVANSLAGNPLAGIISITGTCEFHTTSSTSVNISGTIGINGGYFTIYGGANPCNFLSGGGLVISTGTLDFPNVGIYVANGFNVTASGGIVRTAGDLFIQHPTFNPVNLTFEQYGNADSYLNMAATACLYNFVANKTPGYKVILQTHIHVSHNVIIISGALWAYSFDIYIGGDWYDAVDGLNGGRDIFFNGTTAQYIIGNEYFPALVLNKAMGVLYIHESASVTCGQYRWVSGILVVNGNLTVYGLVGGICGNTTVWGSVDCYLNSSTSIDIVGYVSVWGGVFSIHGGSSPSHFTSSGHLQITNGGIVDFTDADIIIDSGFSSYFETSTLRLAHNFSMPYAGQTFPNLNLELYGAVNSSLSMDVSSHLYDLTISKTPGWHVSLASDLALDHDLAINSGALWATHYAIRIRGNWADYAPEGFDGGASTYFYGSDVEQMIYGTEHFNTLVIINEGSLPYVSIVSGANVSCDNYVYSSGVLFVYGNFVINSGDALTGYIELIGAASVTYYAGAADIDLTGSVSFLGGTFTVISVGSSQVNFLSSGYLYMNSGVFDLSHSDLNIYSGFTIAGNSGTLRTTGNIDILSTSFNPSGLTIEMYGEYASGISVASGSHPYHLKISKAEFSAYVIQESDLLLNGNLLVISGQHHTGGYNLYVHGNINIYGHLYLYQSTIFQIGEGQTLNVYDGGKLTAAGTVAETVQINRTGSSGAYAFNVQSGGTISAVYTHFLYMNSAGILIMPGAFVDDTHAFYHCVFEQGAAGGCLLNFANDQDVHIYAPYFQTNTWGGAYNIVKALDQGHVYVYSYGGAFGGESFDSDPYNRIDWLPAAIPPPLNLSIFYISNANLIRMMWDYPIPEATFNVYKCVDPNGTYLPYYTGLTELYADLPVGEKGFYKVTAVRP